MSASHCTENEVYPPALLIPIGLTNWLKKPAARPHHWKTAIPFARAWKGKSSTRYAIRRYRLELREEVARKGGRTVGERVETHVVRRAVQEDERDDGAGGSLALGGGVACGGDCPAGEDEG